MANQEYVLNSNNTVPNTGAGRVRYFIADTDAGKPASGLVVGDLCWAVDTGILYVAVSTTAWAIIAASSDTTEGKFGYSYPTFVGSQAVGFNLYDLLGTTKFAFGTGKYGASIRLSPVTGQVTLYSTNSGNAGGTATETGQLRVSPNGCSSGGIVAWGDFPSVGNAADPPTVNGTMGKVNRTAQNASIAAFDLTKATSAGLYRIDYFLRTTTQDAVSAATVSFSTTYTDNVGATTETSATVALASTVNHAQGAFVVYLASGNITAFTTVAGLPLTAFYQIRARCTYLG